MSDFAYLCGMVDGICGRAGRMSCSWGLKLRATGLSAWLAVGILAGGASGQAQVKTQYQMISPGHLQDLIDAGLPEEEVEYYFDQPTALLNMGANGKGLTSEQVARVHKAYPHASIGLLLNSFGTNTLTGAPGLEAVLTKGPLPQGMTYIQYDPEGPHNGTPPAETAALEAGDTSYAVKAATLAHAHGLKFIFTPSIDAGMTKAESHYPEKYRSWLKQGRGAWAAVPGVDIYSIQSQQSEGTTVFAEFVKAAVEQARRAAPHTAVDIGIGINPHSPPTVIATGDLIDAYAAGQAAGVDGYWHNVEVGVNADQPVTVYVEYFKQIYANAMAAASDELP